MRDKLLNRRRKENKNTSLIGSLVCKRFKFSKIIEIKPCMFNTNCILFHWLYDSVFAKNNLKSFPDTSEFIFWFIVFDSEILYVIDFSYFNNFFNFFSKTATYKGMYSATLYMTTQIGVY